MHGSEQRICSIFGFVCYRKQNYFLNYTIIIILPQSEDLSSSSWGRAGLPRKQGSAGFCRRVFIVFDLVHKDLQSLQKMSQQSYFVAPVPELAFASMKNNRVFAVILLCILILKL